MAEATLNDVITRMKEEGLLTRNSGTNSLKSAISEIKGVRSDFKGFFNNFGSALQNLGSTQKEFSDMMKSNFEQQQEALATQQRNDTLSDKPKPTETDGTKGAISKLLASIKGLIPKKSPGLLGLLFGGVAAAMAFFPDWVKENLINPIIDVINVFQGEDATTTLGKVVKKVKGAFKFISDNFGEEAAWVTGILTTVAALKPITTLKVLASSLTGFGALGSFLGLPVIGAIGGLVIAAGTLLLAKEGLDYLRNLNIEDEVKSIQEKKTALIKALASGNKDDIETAESELRQILTRMKESMLIDSDRIRNEVRDASKILADEALKRQKDALDRVNKMGELAARDAETMAAVRDIKMGAVTAIVKAETENVEGGALGEAKAQFEKIAGLDIPQKQKDDLIQIIQSGLAQDDTLKFSQRTAIDNEFFKLRNIANDVFDGEDKLLTPKQLTEVNLKLEDMKTRIAEDLLLRQETLAKMGKGFDDGVGGLNMPVVAPTTNDSRDQSTTTYYFYNDNTKDGIGTGLYSGTRLPAGF